MKSFFKKLFLFVIIGLFLFQLPVFTPALAGNPPDAGQSVMQISSGTVLANGSSVFTVTITLKDSSGTILTGDSVSLFASDGAVNVFPSSQSLNGSGQATFTLNSNNPVTSTISIKDITTNTTISRSEWTITFSPTPTTQPTPTPIGTCNDATPAAPLFISAVSNGAHSIMLTWNAVSSASYYLVSYGVSSGSYIYGNPNVGKVTSYEVGSLATAKKYYFAVKAVNGCMPGAYSNEVSAAAGVSAPTPTSIDASGIDVSPTDQIYQSDLTSGTPTPAPSPTQGPPITPVPKAGKGGVEKTIVYSAIGALLLVSIVVLVLVNKSAKKSKKNVPLVTPQQQPPSSDIFNQPDGISPQDGPLPPDDQQNS